MELCLPPQFLPGAGEPTGLPEAECGRTQDVGGGKLRVVCLKQWMLKPPSCGSPDETPLQHLLEHKMLLPGAGGEAAGDHRSSTEPCFP